MIGKLTTVTSKTTNPYDNLALEAYLLRHVEPEECILYLWQNRHTVVIGRNQNSWKECKCSQLSADGGYLARRLSGGGAVFHDLGNLNFTFLLRREDYSVKRQTQVILQAVRGYDIAAERTGRNDIVVDGRKFSGHAYYQSGDCCYHHGTLLIDADKDAMSKYLNVTKEKLQSKGVDSVRSRVANLTEYAPRITVEGMRERLIQSCVEEYGVKAREYSLAGIDCGEIQTLIDRFSSWEWLYGRKIPFTFQVEKRFSWGNAEFQVQVDGGRVLEVNLYSDGMDVEWIGKICHTLCGTLFQADALAETIGQIPEHSGLQKQMKSDLITLLCEST